MHISLHFAESWFEGKKQCTAVDPGRSDTATFSAANHVKESQARALLPTVKCARPRNSPQAVQLAHSVLIVSWS
jgi:hypothetical protein